MQTIESSQTSRAHVFSTAGQRKDLPKEILAALGSANVFYTEQYERYIEGQNKRLIYLYNDQYVIPAILVKKALFQYADLCSEPFSISGTSSETLEKGFLDLVVRSLKEDFGVMWVRQTPVTALFASYPTRSSRIPFGSYLIDLSKTEEEIWAAFSTSYRKYGGQAQRAGITVKAGDIDLLDDFYTLLVASMSRAEAGIESKDFYRNILEELQPYAKVFVAYQDNRPEASVLIIFNQSMSYTLYGGVSSAPHKGSNIYMYWEAMRWLKAAGVSRFSFVGYRINADQGSKYAGIQTFKERFGGELKQGVMFKSVFDPGLFWLFSLLQKTKAILKGSRYPGDVIDQEIRKWRDLNRL